MRGKGRGPGTRGDAHGEAPREVDDRRKERRKGSEAQEWRE